MNESELQAKCEEGVLISLDIGINNPSWCVMGVKTKDIILWGTEPFNKAPEVEVCDYVNESVECGRPAKFELVEDGSRRCGIHSRKKEKSLIVFKKVKKPPIKDSVASMTTLFDSIFLQFLPFTKIVAIELQPSKNPSIKLISHTIYTWFIIRSIDTGVKFTIKFVNAKYKLTVYTGPVRDDLVLPKDPYRRRKMLSIEHARILLSERYPEYIDFFDESKKKDDLSDAFLQALYVLT